MRPSIMRFAQGESAKFGALRLTAILAWLPAASPGSSIATPATQSPRVASDHTSRITHRWTNVGENKVTRDKVRASRRSAEPVR